MAYEDDVLISGWDYPSDCVNRKLRDFSRSFLYIDFVKNQILWTFLKNC